MNFFGVLVIFFLLVKNGCIVVWGYIKVYLLYIVYWLLIYLGIFNVILCFLIVVVFKGICLFVILFFVSVVIDNVFFFWWLIGLIILWIKLLIFFECFCGWILSVFYFVGIGIWCNNLMVLLIVWIFFLIIFMDLWL